MSDVGFIIRRQARTLEFFRVTSDAGFVWGKNTADALRFARAEDAQSVAAILADDAEVVVFADQPATVGSDMNVPAQSGPFSYGDAIAFMQHKVCVASRPGMAGFVARHTETGELMFVPMDGGDRSPYQPSPEDEAAADWGVIEIPQQPA